MSMCLSELQHMPKSQHSRFECAMIEFARSATLHALTCDVEERQYCTESV